MGPEKKSHSTRHKVRRLLSHWSGPLPVKAMPVAFPIRKVVYSVTLLSGYKSNNLHWLRSTPCSDASISA